MSDLIRGLRAAGHLTSSGYWHPGRSDGCPKCPQPTRYVRCERVTATPTSPIHIRALRAGEQPQPGGGVYATTLCGRHLHGWDLPGDVEDRDVTAAACTAETGPTCVPCATAWKKARA